MSNLTFSPAMKALSESLNSFKGSSTLSFDCTTNKIIDTQKFNWKEKIQHLFGYGRGGYWQLENRIDRLALDVLKPLDQTYQNIQSKMRSKELLTEDEVETIEFVHCVRDWRLSQIKKIDAQLLNTRMSKIGIVFSLVIKGLLNVPTYFRELFTGKETEATVEDKLADWCYSITTHYMNHPLVVQAGKVQVGEINECKIYLEFHVLGQTLSIEHAQGTNSLSFKKTTQKNKRYLDLLPPTKKNPYTSNKVLEGILNHLRIQGYFDEFNSVSNPSFIIAQPEPLKGLACSNNEEIKTCQELERLTPLFNKNYISINTFKYIISSYPKV